jgi:hypothetical protein
MFTGYATVRPAISGTDSGNEFNQVKRNTLGRCRASVKAEIWAAILDCRVLAIGPALKSRQEPVDCQLERRRRTRDTKLAQGRSPARWGNGAGNRSAPCTVPLSHIAWLKMTLPGDLVNRDLASSLNTLRKHGLVLEPVPFVLQPLRLQRPPFLRT